MGEHGANRTACPDRERLRLRPRRGQSCAQRRCVLSLSLGLSSDRIAGDGKFDVDGLPQIRHRFRPQLPFAKPALCTGDRMRLPVPKSAALY